MSNDAADFANSMRPLDVRNPKEMHKAFGNLTYAVYHIFERLAVVEAELAEENDELDSLRESAIALAEHVVAGRNVEALDLAKVILSWYEEEETTANDGTGGKEESGAASGINEQTLNGGSGEDSNRG